MSAIDSDEELVQTVARGDAEALETLFERHHRGLYRFFRRAVRPADAAEDLVQEVFLRVWKYARAFSPDGSFRGWLYRIARNAASDRLRDSSRFAPSASAEPLETSDESQPVAGDLAAALSRLSAADREILVLARLQGLSAAELAAALECSTGAARVRVHRALARLRALYLETTEGNRHAMRRVE